MDHTWYMLLSDKGFQLDILDHYSGNMPLREECRRLWRKLGSLKSELSDVEAAISRAVAEKDYNEAQYRQLEAASLREGELVELEEEQKQLANAEDIKTGLCGVEELFTASSSDDSMSVDSSLKESVKMLMKVGRYLPAASQLADRLDSCRLELDDILAEVSDMNSRVDMSQERLEQVESRMSMLYGLLKKHGCADEAELIALRDRLSEELFDSTRLEEQAEDIRKEIAKLDAHVRSIASNLHDSRSKAAADFSEAIGSSIRGLEMPYAVFEVELVDIPVSASGSDAVAFRFSATGRNAVDVAKCASGGEMSRVMLALKSLIASQRNQPTLIFDEVDTGVSGVIAERMGRLMQQMGGANRQVLSITHLPQVAALGVNHYKVHKEETEKGTVTNMIKLDQQERVREIAQMMSGEQLTDAAIENASLLLSQSK